MCILFFPFKMLMSELWKHSRNLPNVVRHVEYMFDKLILAPNVVLTKDNVLCVLGQQSKLWDRYGIYERQQISLTRGCELALTTIIPDLKSNDAQKLKQTRVLDMICEINSNIGFTHAITRVEIGKLALKYKFMPHEWYVYLVKDTIHTDPITAKQNFYDMFHNKPNNIHNMCDLNIEECNNHNNYNCNNLSTLYKLGEYATSKILQAEKEVKP
jgi:hypothetical protein